MSKKVAIMEGDKSRRFNKVDYLSTRKQGGGHVDWVPEDDRNTTTKHITKNGTYKASDEKDSNNKKYYGFSQVTVNVPNADKAIGKKPDGNTHVVQPDENGDLTDKIIPDSIKIISEPYKTTYTNGETISMSGMVVKAYQGDGSIWEATGYSSGIIPHNELTLKPPTAQASGSSGGSTSDLIDFSVISSTSGAVTERNTGGTERVRTDDAVAEGYEKMAYFVASELPANAYRMIMAKAVDASSAAAMFVHNGKGVNLLTRYANFTTIAAHPLNIIDSITEKTNQIAWTMIHGEADTDDNEITVAWNRPDDLKELTDTFSITVYPSDENNANENNEGNNGGGGSGGGSW